MTTNGILLPRLAPALRDAGLRRLNIHVDTFHPERLNRLMRFASVEEVEAGIAAAEQAGLVPDQAQLHGDARLQRRRRRRPREARARAAAGTCASSS